jgi:hypothetical protein
MKFLSLDVLPLLSLFFLQLFVSEKLGHLFVSFVILLLSRFVAFSYFFLVIGELVNSFFKYIEKNVFGLLGMLHQLYNKVKVMTNCLLY